MLLRMRGLTRHRNRNETGETMKRQIMLAIMLVLGMLVVPLVAGTGDVVVSDTKLMPGQEMAVDLGDGVTLKMTWIPPGEFMMGSPVGETGHQPNETQHLVKLTKGFWMGKYEVTQGQWERVMGSDPSQLEQWTRVKGNNPGQVKDLRNPVADVNWKGCQEFLKKLNQTAEVRTQVQTGTFRLPTEAEWEYACRAGTITRFHSGNEDSDLDRLGWHGGNSIKKVHPVGQKTPNQFGLYDMHGNVWEWCQDWYGEYPEGTQVDPQGPVSGSLRVVRGGSWYGTTADCRIAARTFDYPDQAYVGFRVVLAP